MNAVDDVLDRKERPPFVRFERLAVEDKQASAREGRYIAKDVDMALVTPPYSKDIFKQKAADWLTEMNRQVVAQRIPREWMDRFNAQYEAFKNGQSIPLKGSPIRGWGVTSPAQQENLIRLNILTVEDMAACNEEGLRRIGMGAVDLKNKANAWLAQLQDKGPLTQEMAAVKSENAIMRGSIESLTKQVEALMSQRTYAMPVVDDVPAEEISLADILPDAPTLEEQYVAKFGKAPHHMMKQETIAERLKG